MLKVTNKKKHVKVEFELVYWTWKREYRGGGGQTASITPRVITPSSSHYESMRHVKRHRDEVMKPDPYVIASSRPGHPPVGYHNVA